MNDIDISLIFAQLFNFLILFFLFKYFLAERLHTVIQERKEEVEKLSLAEVHYQEKMTLAETQKQTLLQEAHNTSQVLLEESQTLAQTKADILLQDARNQSSALLEGARKEIEKERISMLAQMKSHIVDVSLKLNEKMFGSSQENKEFIEKEFQNMK